MERSLGKRNQGANLEGGSQSGARTATRNAPREPSSNQRLLNSTLEELYGMLKSTKRSSEDTDLILFRMMAETKERGNAAKARTVSEVREFIERKEGSRSGDGRGVKAMALEILGTLGGPEVRSLLRFAFTDAGARELAKAWLDEPMIEEKRFAVDHGWAIVDIRGRAAVGLASAGSDEDMAVVRAEYERLLKLRIDDPKQPRRHDEAAALFCDKHEDALLGFLIDSMARRDLFAERGANAFTGDLMTDLDAMRPYLEKYERGHVTSGG